MGISNVQQLRGSLSFVKNPEHNNGVNPIDMYLKDSAERLPSSICVVSETMVQAIELYLRSVSRYVGLFKLLVEEPSDEAHIVFEYMTRQNAW